MHMTDVLEQSLGDNNIQKKAMVLDSVNRISVNPCIDMLKADGAYKLHTGISLKYIQRQ